MKKILFIIPYFGKFNNYFQLFLNSCKENNEYNWLIITDDNNNYKYPSNVSVIYESFEKFKKNVEKKFDWLNISLDSPYKLCDYKPAYGYIFEDKVKDYKYWGYCDVDLIFGNINKCLDLESKKEYDKIGVLGHFTIFKNTKEIRELFLKDDRYKKVYTSSKNYKFDEEFGEELGKSINNIFLQFNKKILSLNNFADIYVKSSNFKITNYNDKLHNYKTEKNKNGLFLYDKGNIIRYYVNNNKLYKNEFLYIHLQKRKMKLCNLKDYNYYKIIPNQFCNLNYGIINYSNFLKEKKKNLNLHYFKIRLKNLKQKLKKRISA